MQIFEGFFLLNGIVFRDYRRPKSHADSVCSDGECYSAKIAVPPAHAFAFPIRKRMFLPEHILQCGCKKGTY